MLYGIAGNASSSFGSREAAPGPQSELQEQFMQIMLAQLRHQDPMEPMKEQEFFAQLAQCAVVSEVQTLNRDLTRAVSALLYGLESQRLMGAASIIGRHCEWQEGACLYEGTVEAVMYKDCRVFLRSGEWEFPVEHLTFVGGVEHGDTDS